MGDRPLFPLMLFVWVGCGIASAVIGLLFDVKIPFFALVILIFCFGSLVAFAFQKGFDGVMAIIAPGRNQPKAAHEQQQFQPLIDLANSRNGTYEALGRAGRTVFDSDLGTYTATAKVGASKLHLVVSSPIPLAGFILELSCDVIRRTDLTKFTYGDRNVDREFCVGSNDPELARQVVDQCRQQLLALGDDFSLSSIRGSHELRRQLPFLDDANVTDSLNALESIHHALAGLSNTQNAAA